MIKLIFTIDFFISSDSSLVTWLNLSPFVLTILPSLYRIIFFSSCYKNGIVFASKTIQDLTPFLLTLGLWYFLSFSVSTKP